MTMDRDVVVVVVCVDENQAIGKNLFLYLCGKCHNYDATPYRPTKFCWILF